MQQSLLVQVACSSRDRMDNLKQVRASNVAESHELRDLVIPALGIQGLPWLGHFQIQL
jgi:hypothetical protein